MIANGIIFILKAKSKAPGAKLQNALDLDCAAKNGVCFTNVGLRSYFKT